MTDHRQTIIGNHYFAQASAECQLTFEYECYFACIVLCQSVAEGYAKFLYEKYTQKASTHEFSANIKKMIADGVVPDVTGLLRRIWGVGNERNDFHHLNKEIPTDYEQLREIATEKIGLLNNVESEVFCFEFKGNGINVRYLNTGRELMMATARICDSNDNQPQNDF